MVRLLFGTRDPPGVSANCRVKNGSPAHGITPSSFSKANHPPLCRNQAPVLKLRMSSFIRHLISCSILIFVAAAAISPRPQPQRWNWTDKKMIVLASLGQNNAYYAAGQQPLRYSRDSMIYQYPGPPQLSKQLEQQNRIKFVGTYEPPPPPSSSWWKSFLRFLRLSKKPLAEDFTNKQIYFLSYIFPHEDVELEMRLHGRISSALWRYDTVTKKATLIHLSELVHNPNVGWSLESLGDILRRH
ncbi:uncharacterized protein UTRI_10671 [Ustilago trichophora]|uniref:Uncharacterized protein n=1 Tax=Ustilago trichophora TaxID=86804 RepID=A0A5C3ECP5_9BASI|nr:uncharacterized protein UTRI_10671 [Ustilago trichophora]